MTKKIVLYDKIYTLTETDSERKRRDVFANYSKYMKENIKGFLNTSAKIHKLRKFDKRFEINIDGPEKLFVSNILSKEIGTIHEFKDIEVGRVYKGTMVDVGKVGFGIFVDCAIMNPKTDVLISLHKLRDQFCNGKELSLKEIIKAYNFIDHFPGMVKITEVDKEKNKIQGEYTKEYLSLYIKLVNENLDAVFVSGATKNQFKKALIRKGHLRDIVSIKRYGYLEHIVILKEGTEAPGIISHAGNYLRNCKLSAIRHSRIRNFIGSNL